MKQRILTSVIAFSLLATMSGWGQTNGDTLKTVKDERHYSDALGYYLYTGPVNERKLPDGFGEAIFLTDREDSVPDGRKYVGPFRWGYLHGEEYAIFTMANGDTFVGRFKHDYFDKGQYTIAETGDHFIGEFFGGTPYKGTWYNQRNVVTGVVNKTIVNDILGNYLYTGPLDHLGRPNGKGEAIFIKGNKPDGREYRGPFDSGTFGGTDQAEMKMGNGDTFSGTFKHNHFSEGTYTVKATGEYFTGEFRDGLPYKGMWYNKKGKKILEVDEPKKNPKEDEIHRELQKALDLAWQK